MTVIKTHDIKIILQYIETLPQLCPFSGKYHPIFRVVSQVISHVKAGAFDTQGGFPWVLVGPLDTSTPT